MPIQLWSLLHGPVGVAYSKADKVEVFALHLEWTFSESADSDNRDDSLEEDAVVIADELSRLQRRPLDPVIATETSAIIAARTPSPTGPSKVYPVLPFHCLPRGLTAF